MNIISNNKVYGGIYGITLQSNGYEDVITHNDIQDFYLKGITIDRTNSTIIEYNDIHRTGRTDVGDFTGIENLSAVYNLRINANKIHDTHTSAINKNGTARGIVFNNSTVSYVQNEINNNLLYNFNNTSGNQYGFTGNNLTNFSLYHNTIVLDNPASTSGTARGIYLSGNFAGTKIKNNIIYISRNGTGAKHGLYYDNISSGIVSNTNVIYLNTPTASVSGIGSIGGTTNFPTLADWKTANNNSYDQQSISTDPLFENPFLANYKPTSDSINNKGENLGVYLDILGIPRTYTPDPGAFEFSVNGHRTYVFKGNGNWSNPANWTDNLVPPNPLPLDNEVLIYPSEGGNCLLDVPYKVSGVCLL